MSNERSFSSAKPRTDRGNGVDVGVGADATRTPNLRAGATFMKSVSIFLMSGRKASVNTKRQTSGSPKFRKKHRGKMPEVGAARNSTHTTKLIESLKRKTRFSWSELDNLCKMYKKLTNCNQQQVGQSVIVGRRSRTNQSIEGIDRSIFRDLLHNTFKVITEDTLVERIFCCWDRENEGIIRLEPWIMGLDLYLRGSFREKIEFCFRVYDLNNDGFITKDEIFQLFKSKSVPLDSGYRHGGYRPNQNLVPALATRWRHQCRFELLFDLKNCLMKQPGEEDPEEAVRDLSEMALKKLDVDRDGKISFQDYKVAVLEESLLLEAFGQCLATDENRASILLTLQS